MSVKKLLVAGLSSWLCFCLSADAFAQACEQIGSESRTPIQIVQAQLARSKTAILVPDMAPEKCFPHAKSAMLMGAPVCQMNFKSMMIPVVGLLFGSTEVNPNAEISLYMMRGTAEDVRAARNYFDSLYTDMTAEYLSGMKGPRFYGPVRVWKNGDQIIVLGQDEPGYDSVNMSLTLIMASRNGLAMVGVNAVTCQ